MLRWKLDVAIVAEAWDAMKAIRERIVEVEREAAGNVTTIGSARGAEQPDTPRLRCHHEPRAVRYSLANPVASVIQLPPSVGATVTVLTGLALILSYAGTATTGTRAATRAGQDVHTKAKRLYEELLELQTAMEDVRRLLAAGPGQVPQQSPAELTAQVEHLADQLERVRKSVARTRQGAAMMGRAIQGAKAYEPVLAKVYKGWSQEVSKVPEILGRLTDELDKFDLPKLIESVFPSVHDMLSLTLAEEGFGVWARSLPAEEGALVNDEEGEAIRWKSGEGWIVGAR